jgi:vancomycin resistance protein VanJ
MKRIQTMLVVFSAFSILSFCSIFIPPHKFFLAGILSLAIPFFTVVNIVCLIFLLLRKSYWAVLPSIMIIFAAFILSCVFSFQQTDDKPESSIHIMTYNINKLNPLGKPLGKDLDRSSLKTWIQNKNFDVVCLQEMIENDLHPFLLNGYNKIFSGKITDEGDKLGIFIFSRYPIVNHGKIEFGDNSFNRLIWADIILKGDTIRLISVHLKSYNFGGKSVLQDIEQLRLGVIGRSYHAKKTYDFVKKSPYPTILAGDFNEAPYSYAYRRIASLLEDTFSGSGSGYQYTYKVKRQLPFRIDYIFMSQHFKASDYQVLHAASWSDHSPVSVRIGWNPSFKK